MAGISKYLVAASESSHLAVIGERPQGAKEQMQARMEHAACSLPGSLALAVTQGRTLAEARKTSGWDQKKEDDMSLARELLKTCWGMYKFSASNLAAEVTEFVIHESFEEIAQHRVPSTAIEWTDTPLAAKSNWRTDFSIPKASAYNLQSSETVQSLFYLWRITGDLVYREIGWEMFSSFINHTTLSDGSGFTSLENVNILPPPQRDFMESTWLSRTLKYFYLLFSPDDLLPLETVVINAGAHPFPRFKLQRGLKTGWKRRLRGEDVENLDVKETETLKAVRSQGVEAGETDSSRLE